MERSLRGRCLCGQVQYQVEDHFRYALICHCSQCRLATGSAFKPFAGIEREFLRVLEGAIGVTRYGDESTFDARCNSCGSLLFSVVRDGAYVHVPLGSLLDEPSIRASAHIHVSSKASWDQIEDDLPQYAEFPIEE